MANKTSSARQALKDMLEAGLDISFLIGKIRRYHQLNAEINIITRKESKPKVEVEIHVAINYMPPEVYQPAPQKRYYINPDGTISSSRSDWDRD